MKLPRSNDKDSFGFESLLLSTTDQGGPIKELASVTSYPGSAEITVQIGPTRVVLDGESARGLAKALAEHVDRLGDRSLWLVRQRIERWHVPDDGRPGLPDYTSRWVEEP